MKLVNMVPVLERGTYKLVSTVDELEIRINEATLRVLQRMAVKSLEELEGVELTLYQKLKDKQRITDGRCQLRLRGTYGLHSVGVEVTDACNLRCRHCYLGEKANLFLKHDAYERAVDDAVELGVHGVMFTGGEPLLDKRLFDKIRYARERDCKTSLVTNGTFITAEHARTFARLHIEAIAVTLNGFKKEHEGLYGPNTYERALRGLKHLIAAGNHVFVNFNIYKGNQHVLPEFEKFCRSLGVKGINVSHVKPVEWGAEMREEIVKETPRCCGKGGRELVTIKADGRVVPCVFLNEQTMGNIYEERFKEIYLRCNGG